MTKLRTSITKEGTFRVGIHKPAFDAENYRVHDYIEPLGQFQDGSDHINTRNFPETGVKETNADWIYEIPNPFPFRGTTYIVKSWAERHVVDPGRIKLPAPPDVSFSNTLNQWFGSDKSETQDRKKLFSELPDPVLLALASSSTDPEDLSIIAELSCDFTRDPDTEKPLGMRYFKTDEGNIKSVIHHHDLFETVVNNPYLPDTLKNIMVLRPGVQGDSEILAEWQEEEGKSHVFEYLRRNSYIPWGHYASNMANDSIRYHIRDLNQTDIRGLRHLYYQRTYSRLAGKLGIKTGPARNRMTPEELDIIRKQIRQRINKSSIPFNGTLWGWNFGFGCAHNGYRQHASHQQIHQQFALLPKQVRTQDEEASVPSYGCGDLVYDFITRYRKETGQSFFENYLKSIYSNKRTDGKSSSEQSGLSKNLVIYEDEDTLLFVPKAQTSQWELQLMTKNPLGNILETNTRTRDSLDLSILKAMQCLTRLGAQMITVIEYSKRFHADPGQHLLYAFLPKLPYAGIAFTEQQMRWICGHYPEDFAESCRRAL